MHFRSGVKLRLFLLADWIQGISVSLWNSDQFLPIYKNLYKNRGTEVDKPARLIIRLLFGFARQGGNAVCAVPWLKRVTRVSAIIHNFLISGQTILRRHQFATSCKTVSLRPDSLIWISGLPLLSEQLIKRNLKGNSKEKPRVFRKTMGFCIL